MCGKVCSLKGVTLITFITDNVSGKHTYELIKHRIGTLIVTINKGYSLKGVTLTAFLININ